MVVAVKLFVFACLRDQLQVDRGMEVSIEENNWSSSNELKMHLLNLLQKIGSNSTEQKQHQIVNPKTIMLAINEKFVEPNEEISLSNEDIIALIPPVSGG